VVAGLFALSELDMRWNLESLFRAGLVAWLLMMTMGCTETKHGLCEEPQKHIEWFYIEETGAPWVGGKVYKCIICDLSVEEEDVPAWIEENAGEDFLNYATDLDKYLPCLYTYHEDESLEGCKAAACGGDWDVNDPVGKEHGAGKIISGYLDMTYLEGHPTDAMPQEQFHILPYSLPEEGIDQPVKDRRLLP
jgi:hypothetical protein